MITLLGDDDGQQPPIVEVGRQIVLEALVRNQSHIVDSYELAVEGTRDGWWTIEPDTVHLLPVDTGERYEESIQVSLHPPRSPDASATCWPIEITATSVAHKARAASVSTQFEIARFEEIAIELVSKPTSGRRRGCAKVAVLNASNHPVDVALSGSEEKDLARLSFAEAEVSLAPKQAATVDVVVSPDRQIPVGRSLEHRLQLTATIVPTAATSAKPTDKPPSCTATYVQRSWLPWWTPRLLAALLVVALVVTAYFIKKHSERVPVPNVRGHYISEARAELESEDVKAVEKIGVTSLTEIPSGNPEHPNVEVGVGDVYREVPEVGTRVAPGSEVKLYAAIRPSSTPVHVPDLYDLTTKAAENRLSAAGFAIGDIQPFPPPKGYVVVSQTPAMTGEKVLPSAKVVEVTLGQLAVIPSILGQAPAAAAVKLSALSLVLGPIQPSHPRQSEVIAVQKPTANRVVAVGTTIETVLGEAVPKLVGLTALQARRKLDAAGFARPRLMPSAPPAKDVIVRQSPAPTSIVPTSTHVTLVAKPPPVRHEPKPKHAAKVNPKAPTNPKPSIDSNTAVGSRAATSAPELGAVAAPEPSTEACVDAPHSSPRSVRPEPSPDPRTPRARCRAAARR